MKTQHTQGKLVVRKHSASVTLCAEDGFEVAFIPDEEHHTLTNGPIQNANAAELVRRWNAAPELAEALRACLSALDAAWSFDGNVFGVHHNDATDATENARAVLAKLEAP